LFFPGTARSAKISFTLSQSALKYNTKHHFMPWVQHIFAEYTHFTIQPNQNAPISKKAICDQSICPSE
jgi:hypothetical protein